MKRACIIRCLICVICGVICGLCFAAVKEDLAGLFYSANKLYEQGKYEEAAAEYKKIIDTGFQSGTLYYNLGNCYFKLGSLGKTILYYEKAKRLMPQNPDLKFNYKYVNSLLEDRIETPRKNLLMRKLNVLSGFYSFGKWLGAIAILWIVLMGIITLCIFLPGLRGYARYAYAGLIILLVLCVICAKLNYNVYSIPAGIVIPKETVVRYGPGEAEVEAFLLHEGTKVYILKEEDNWWQIQLPDEKTGWIPKDSVEII